MKQEGRGKRITAILLAVLMMISAAFCTEVPVSAATMTSNTVKAQISGSSTVALRISWNKVPQASGYVIYRRESTRRPYKRHRIVSGKTTTFLDRNLVSGKPYQYAVRAYRKEGNRNVYSKYQAVIGATRPQPVKAKVRVASSTSARITWSKSSRADGYMIYRRAAGQKWQFVSDRPKNQTSYPDRNLSPGTKYVYCVRPYKKGGSTKYMAALKNSNIITTPGTSVNKKFTSAQKEVVKKILYAVETGGQVYGHQDYRDFTEAYTNSSAEHAITIGAGQWYGVEAQRLLKLIHSKYPKTWKKYDPKNYVWNDVVKKDWSTYKLPKNAGRAKIIVKLISSPDGIKCQDELMYTQIDEMEAEIRRLGINDPQAVAMFINIRHQGGYGAVTRILAKTKRPVNLDNIYRALQSDTGNQVGAYKNRQRMVYNSLKKYMK